MEREEINVGPRLLIRERVGSFPDVDRLDTAAMRQLNCGSM